jgi:hypothetical protein
MEGKNLPVWVPNITGLTPSYQEIGRQLSLAHFQSQTNEKQKNQRKIS